MIIIFAVPGLFNQGGGILIYSVLRSSSLVKVLTKYFLSWHCIYFTIVGFIAEILLDLDHLDRIYQRDIVVYIWLLFFQS